MSVMNWTTRAYQTLTKMIDSGGNLAITSGTIDGATIGSTTPSTGAFTTITAGQMTIATINYIDSMQATTLDVNATARFDGAVIVSASGNFECGVGQIATLTSNDITATTVDITTANITDGNFTTTASVTAVGGFRANAPNFSRGSYITLGDGLAIAWGETMWRTAASVASAIASIEDAVAGIVTNASPDPGCMFLNQSATIGIGGCWVRGANAASWHLA